MVKKALSDDRLVLTILGKFNIKVIKHFNNAAQTFPPSPAKTSGHWSSVFSTMVVVEESWGSVSIVILTEPITFFLA